MFPITHFPSEVRGNPDRIPKKRSQTRNGRINPDLGRDINNILIGPNWPPGPSNGPSALVPGIAVHELTLI
jgi:hypothetical protein